MNKSLLVVKLYDESVIYAKEWKIKPGGFILKNTKTMRENENPIYIDDEINVSNDAIQVWFKVLKGREGNN